MTTATAAAPSTTTSTAGLTQVAATPTSAGDIFGPDYVDPFEEEEAEAAAAALLRRCGPGTSVEAAGQPLGETPGGADTLGALDDLFGAVTQQQQQQQQQSVALWPTPPPAQARAGTGTSRRAATDLPPTMAPTSSVARSGRSADDERRGAPAARPLCA